MADIKINAAIASQVALLEVAGETPAQIAERTGLTRHQVKLLREKEEYKVLVKSLEDEIIGAEKQKLMAAFAKMTTKVIKAMEANLDGFNLEAVKYYFKALKIGEGTDAVANTQINVMLPGTAGKEAIEVPSVKVQNGE